jgi:hypothetical protein
MDPRTVEKLECKIEDAISGVIVSTGLKRLPLLPSRHTFQIVAKPPMAVNEAAMENQRPNE